MHHVLILGAGISGLTTAWTLLDRGYRITILASRYASKDEKITSQVSGALWEWPPPVCGRHWLWDETCLESFKSRSLISFNRFKQLADNPATGVRMRTSNFLFLRPISSCPVQTKKMAEVKEKLPGFRYDNKIIQELGINPNYGIVESYCHLAPVIDSDQYMDWLMKYLKSRNGVRFITREVTGDLFAQESELLKCYEADVIVNATGLNAKELVGDDTVFPLRGAYVRVINDGSRFPQVTQSMSVSLDYADPDYKVFIIPRNDNTLVLGTIGEMDQMDLNVNLNNCPPIKRMYEKDLDFYPALKKGQIDPNYPIAVGIRPFRKTYVRVERESKHSRIVHNYGHGDSGFTLSFGCAEDVVNITDEISKEINVNGCIHHYTKFNGASTK